MKKKSLSVAKQAKTQLNFQQIYKIFKSNILKKISKKNFAVAVSGGPDSLCLAYLSKKYGDELLKGARKEVESLENKLKELNFQSNPDNETEIKNLKYKLKMGKKAVLAMRNINRQNLGPVLDTYRQRKKMKASKKKVKRIKTM